MEAPSRFYGQPAGAATRPHPPFLELDPIEEEYDSLHQRSFFAQRLIQQVWQGYVSVLCFTHWVAHTCGTPLPGENREVAKTVVPGYRDVLSGGSGEIVGHCYS